MYIGDYHAAINLLQIRRVDVRNTTVIYLCEYGR